jgi:hypothetical protein
MARNALLFVFVFGLCVTAASLLAQAPAAPLSKTVTFNKDVPPIAMKNCQTCHRPGQIGPFSMLTYKDARPWAKAMKTAVVSRIMPPWLADPRYGHFSNDRSLKRSEIDTIAAWADGGAVEGDPKDAPPSIQAAGESTNEVVKRTA